jgi:hypothetical protein
MTTTQPPNSLRDATAIATESLAALVASDLTADQKQHVGNLVNCYLYSSKQGRKTYETALELERIAREAIAALNQPPQPPA